MAIPNNHLLKDGLSPIFPKGLCKTWISTGHLLSRQNVIIKSKLIAVNTKLVLGHKLYNFVFFCCSDERKKSASSLDDLFLLYAALQFNQSCYIVTGDYMRDHISKLKENLTELCSRWILSKSIKTFQRVSPNTWVS